MSDTSPTPEDMQTFLDQIAAAQALVAEKQAECDAAMSALVYAKGVLRDLQGRAREQFSSLVGA